MTQPGDPDEPETEGWELVFPSIGDELVVRKSEPNAFGSNPQLAQVLRDKGFDRVRHRRYAERVLRSGNQPRSHQRGV